MNQLTIDDMLFDENKAYESIKTTVEAITNAETQQAFLELERTRQLDTLWKILADIPIDKRKILMARCGKVEQETCIEAIVSKHVAELYLYGGNKDGKTRSEA